MKILLIHNYYQQRGGEDVYVDSLERLLLDNGHNVAKYTKKSIKIDSFKDKANTSINMFHNKKINSEVDRIIKSFKPDIAHINNLYPLISPDIYEILSQNFIPIVQTIHTYRLMCPKTSLFRNGKICEDCLGKKFAYPSIIHKCFRGSRLASFLLSSLLFYQNYKKNLQHVNKFIFPSEFTRTYYIKNLPMQSKKTIVMPHFANDLKPRSIQKSSGKYFLYVGRLSEEKGILELVKVFSKLPYLKLIILGEGPLEKMIRAYRLPNIQVKGYVSTLLKYSYIKRALFTIIPSLIYEQGPLVLMESLANGTPVIVPDLSIFKEKVKQNKTGLFYSYADNDSMLETIIQASRLESTSHLKKFARAEYTKKYTPDVYHSSLIKLYSNILNRNKGYS